MRGKASSRSSSVWAIGITPAYAGKRTPFPQISALAWDHPRLCGEKGFGLFPQPLYIGSPPPMRGKEIKSINPRPARRITPAYAGKRQAAGETVPPVGDHPRLCGEKGLPHGAVFVF